MVIFVGWRRCGGGNGKYNVKKKMRAVVVVVVVWCVGDGNGYRPLKPQRMYLPAVAAIQSLVVLPTKCESEKRIKQTKNSK